MKTKNILFFIILFFMIVSVAGAVEREEKEKFIFYADIYQGYDNNVDLDSSRNGDMFTESYTEIGCRHRFTDDFTAAIDYNLITVNYHEQTDATFYDNNAFLDFDLNLFEDKALLSFDNGVSYNYYPNEETSTYFLYNSRVGIKQRFSEYFFQKLSYDFILKNYSDRKAEDGAGAKKDSKQEDIRNSVTHELSGLVFNNVLIKLRNQYFINDSNDQYMDYYDYWSYRFTATAIIPLLTERLYGLVSAGYQLRDYKTRQLVNDASKTQKDDAFDISSSVMFDVTKTISLSLNYTYGQNWSNEPSEEYSGSMMSAGLHYAF